MLRGNAAAAWHELPIERGHLNRSIDRDELFTEVKTQP